MITWLQTFFLKHNKWLFSALLIVIIVTFVLTIGNQSFFGGREGPTRAEAREYYGYNLNNPAEMERVFAHAEISAMLHPDLGIQGPAMQKYALMRVAALGLANEMGIAAPTSEQVRAHLESLDVFQLEEAGSFDRELYTQYRDFISARIPDGERVLARVLREDYRIARIREALSGPGYVVPAMLERDFADRETEWQIQIAQRSYADFQAEIDPSQEELQSFYQEDPARFEIPERIQVSAVRFSADNFLDAVGAPTEGDLQTYFGRYSFRYQPRPNEDGEEAPEVTLEDVRDQVASDYRRDQAKRLAEQASDGFLTSLYERQIERRDPAFNQLLQQTGGRLDSVPPYGRNNPPRQGGIPAEVYRSMWIYATGDRYYSDLTATQDGAAVLIFEEYLPAHIPPFEEIAAQVESVWTAENRRERFAQAAQQWEDEIRSAVASGTSFEEAASEAGFTVTSPDSFMGSDIPTQLYQYQLADELRRLDTDNVSPVVTSQMGAAVAYVRQKTVSPVDTASQVYQDYVEQELEARRQSNGWVALSAWTDRTLAVATPEMATRL